MTAPKLTDTAKLEIIAGLKKEVEKSVQIYKEMKEIDPEWEPNAKGSKLIFKSNTFHDEMDKEWMRGILLEMGVKHEFL